MIKNLVAFGCSCTYGEGLLDPDNEAYPALVAKQLGVPCTNLAEPGMSLTSMVWTLNAWLNDNSAEYIRDTLVIVGLTFDVRQTWFNANYEVYKGLPGDPTYVGYKYIDSTCAPAEEAPWKDLTKLHYTLSDCDEYNRLHYETTVRQFDALVGKYGCQVFQLNVNDKKHAPVDHVIPPMELGHYLVATRGETAFFEDRHPNEFGHRIYSKQILSNLRLR